MHLSPASRTLLTRAGAACATTALLVVGFAAPAAANPPGPHDPIGAVTATAAATGGVQFTGWAGDPDEPSTNITVGVLVDGRSWAASGPTTLANAAMSTKHGLGPTPGFALTAPVDTLPHTLCVVARNVDAGLDTVLACTPTPLGTRLTAAQVATHSPAGRIEHAAAHSTTLRFRGWATDPDYVGRRATVVLYIDGSPAATVITQLYPAPRPDGAGPRSAYDISVPVSAGTHIGCIWVVNIGLGKNTFQGCQARDTRGPAGTGTVTVAPQNKTAVAVAKRKIGDPYVWGATGPDRFDCSGLVMFSYGRAGLSTPRVSEAQALAARLIPAARAVPGDLVFFHDNVGDVYHVAIYLSPGLTVAAIDTDQGVNYQKIWDPTSATYGSFTHI
jgi:cell wall-associated NlpC family hydrolase